MNKTLGEWRAKKWEAMEKRWNVCQFDTEAVLPHQGRMNQLQSQGVYKHADDDLDLSNSDLDNDGYHNDDDF